MAWLILVSLGWAFSFGLIKGQLAGLDSTAVAVVRLGLSALVFLPFLRRGTWSGKQLAQLMGIGAIQFGLMYVLYLYAYRFAAAHEVALFAIFTPIYVMLLDAAWRRQWRWLHGFAALLSVLGAGVILAKATVSSDLVTAFLLMQASNLCFAVGQLAYKYLRARAPTGPDHACFGWLYLGAIALSGIYSVGAVEWTAFAPTPSQWGVLVYLGAVASALGFFGWNYGATKVNTGTLAVFNNLKVPLAVACSLLFFGESADVPRLLISLGLLASATWLTERSTQALAK